jgi:hypothetical protein
MTQYRNRTAIWNFNLIPYVLEYEKRNLLLLWFGAVPATGRAALFSNKELTHSSKPDI